MSLLDSYRNRAAGYQNEIARLQNDKASKAKKISDLSGRIISASESLQRTNSQSTVQSKRREIERYQKDQAKVEKEIAEIEKKIADKTKQLHNEQKNISKEESRQADKRAREASKQARNHAARMKKIDGTLSQHSAQHRQTSDVLERLQRLPDEIVVLFLAANPVDQQQLRLDEEARAIQDMVRKSEHRDAVKFETRWAIRPMDVLQAINELSPTIVHFSGHGSDTDEIIFQGEGGETKAVSKDAIVQTMMASSGNIRLVFFNTCYSRNQAEAVTQYVEAAVGMNTSIGDEAARVFSSQFYSSIGFGLSVEKSFNQAKALVMMEGIKEENTPELFVQYGLNANDLHIVSKLDE